MRRALWPAVIRLHGRQINAGFWLFMKMSNKFGEEIHLSDSPDWANRSVEWWESSRIHLHFQHFQMKDFKKRKVFRSLALASTGLTGSRGGRDANLFRSFRLLKLLLRDLFEWVCLWCMPNPLRKMFVITLRINLLWSWFDGECCWLGGQLRRVVDAVTNLLHFVWLLVSKRMSSLHTIWLWIYDNSLLSTKKTKNIYVGIPICNN